MYVKYRTQSNSESLELITRVSYVGAYIIINSRFVINCGTHGEAYSKFKSIMDKLASEPSIYNDSIYDIGEVNIDWTVYNG